MMLLRFIALLVFFAAAAFAGQGRAQETLKVIVYGDSITAGQQLQPNETYAAKLGYKLRDMGYTNVDVQNLGNVSLTTTAAADGIADIVFRRPDVVVVQLGNNEMLREVSADVIYKNLVVVISRLQQAGAYVVLLGVRAPERMPQAYSRQLDSIFSRLASFYSIAYYPDVLDGIRGKPDLTLADGYYPNGQGIDLLVDNTYTLVDAGLRWRWSVLSDRQGTAGTDGSALPMPVNVEPAPRGLEH